jgi:D-sedoheptulose 7-phosphate isomerase
MLYNLIFFIYVDNIIFYMKKTNPNQLLKNEIDILKYTINLLENDNFSKINNFQKLCKISLNAVKNKKKIIFFGNGGSAADSQHLATELTIRYKKKRKSIPSISLSSDNSAITAAGNDFGFKFIFSRQLEAVANPGDIVVALTTSGNSPNLIEACKVANKKKVITSCFSGNNGGKLKKYTNLPVVIPSKSTSVIQTIELLLGHVFCEYLERNI